MDGLLKIECKIKTISDYTYDYILTTNTTNLTDISPSVTI